MEKKNMVLLTVIAVATLLVAVVGATFAYFTATVTDSRDEGTGGKGQADIEAAKVPGNLLVEKSSSGFESFDDQNVYPGHKELIVLKITSDTDNTNDTFFNIVYKGTNSFPENGIEFKIYESTEDITGVSEKEAFKCTQKSDIQDGSTYKFYEECALDENLQVGLDGQTHLLQTTPLKTDVNHVIINGEHPFVITGTSDKREMYYYVVVEYKNLQSSQNSDSGAKLDGNITVEMAPSDTNAIKDDESHITKKQES